MLCLCHGLDRYSVDLDFWILTPCCPVSLVCKIHPKMIKNVLTGDMGFVGPRPALFNQDDFGGTAGQLGGLAAGRLGSWIFLDYTEFISYYLF